MADLGDFEAAVREVDPAAEQDTFRFCGEHFTVAGEIPPMLMMQLGAAATGKIDEAEGFAAMWEALRCSLTVPEQGDTPADKTPFDRLYKLAVSQGVDLQVVMRLVFKLFEAQGGRPTKRALDSSPGASSTSPSTSPSSTHPALAHLRPVSEVLAG